MKDSVVAMLWLCNMTPQEVDVSKTHGHHYAYNQPKILTKGRLIRNDRRVNFEAITPLGDGKKQCTHVLDQRDALILVVVELLLLSKVFVLGGLETHGYHLCAGQHRAAFDAISTELSKKMDPAPASSLRGALVLVGGVDGCGMMVSAPGWRWTLPAALCLHDDEKKKLRLYTTSSYDS